MDTLPVEMIQRILSFCNVRDVISVSSINKKCREAAKRDLGTRKSLSYSDIRPTRIILWINNLKKLELSGAFSQCVWQLITKLIQENATTLESLELGDEDMPTGSIVYPRLKKLICRNLDVEVARCCPALSSLMVREQESAEAIENLALTIEELDCDFYAFADINANTFTKALSRYTNLTYVVLHVKNMTTWKEPGNMADLFQGLTKLVYVTVYMKCISCDQMVARLVRENPGIQQLTLYQLSLTDDALDSISELTQLSTLDLNGDDFTTDGCIRLLKGNSRLSLRKVYVNLRGTLLDKERIREELQTMSAETGHRYTLLSDYHFNFVVEDD